MNLTDWILDSALILIVLRQLREAPINRSFVTRPLIIISVVVFSYLKAIPTAGNDLVLVGTLVAIGAVLGVLGGTFTHLRAEGRSVLIKASALSAVLWVVGTGSRLAFQLWSDHGGAGHIASFSRAHDITSSAAWVDAFVLMALTEVLTRMVTILVRAQRARQVAPVAIETRIPVSV